ncbi:MAG TPA: hypothetical protein VGL39_08935 [Jatrophihabitantaceae bacterium]|jgi:Ser/Thr protein kinase RdoA (MazF antagonist)
MTSPAAQGVRTHWDDLPGDVRAAICALLGADVVAAETQPQGFSPGLAARLRLADGQRVFVKAVSASANAESPAMHRAEARLTSAFPPGVPVPRLLDVHDDGDWVALVYEDVAGRHPSMPWRMDELEHVMDTLARLHEMLTPCPVPDVGRVADDPGFIFEFASWSRLRGGPGDGLDGWTRAHLAELAELESGWRPAAAGDTLIHVDLRADNMLIRPDGDVVFVDWPWGARGAPLLDVVALAPSVAMQGGPDVDWLVARHLATRDADPSAVNALLAALAGMFTYRALEPPPPGLPTLRAFQDAQGRAARRMLAERLGNR